MEEASDDPAQLQTWLDRMQAGDPAARAALLGHACERLRRLTRKMLKGFANVKRLELTDDVLQNALLRLWKALQEVRPPSPRAFYGLAALQIRRELIDLARQYSRPQGGGIEQAHQAPGDDTTDRLQDAREQADTTYDPAVLAIWTEFHRQVDLLPEEEREVFDLLWYQGLTYGEATALLVISEATLKRRWLAARRRLIRALKGDLPGS